jgi:hypothetical protein
VRREYSKSFCTNTLVFQTRIGAEGLAVLSCVLNKLPCTCFMSLATCHNQPRRRLLLKSQYAKKWREGQKYFEFFVYHVLFFFFLIACLSGYMSDTYIQIGFYQNATFGPV